MDPRMSEPANGPLMGGCAGDDCSVLTDPHITGPGLRRLGRGGAEGERTQHTEEHNRGVRLNRRGQEGNWKVWIMI